MSPHREDEFARDVSPRDQGMRARDLFEWKHGLNVR